MIDQQTADNIIQKKLDSLCAKHLHINRLVELRRWDRAVGFAAIAVPALYFAFRFLAKGTTIGPYVEFAWEVLAGLLMCLTVYKSFYAGQELVVRHSNLLGENIALIRQADNILNTRQTTSLESAQLFFSLVEKTDFADYEMLGRPDDDDRMFAYREGLKELKINCPQCAASPWNYLQGSCQACGNTPQNKNSEKG